MKLHHIGKVVENISESMKYHIDFFGMIPVGEPVIDEIQKVEVIAMETGYGLAPVLELITPVSEDSPVYKFLTEKGDGLHHMGFEVADIKAAAIELRNRGALILGNIVPSKCFGEKPSLWLFSHNRELVELIENKI